MSKEYDVLAKSLGETRVFVNSTSPLPLALLKAEAGYMFAWEGEHRDETAPWEYALGNPQGIESTEAFLAEKDRVVGLIAKLLANGWEADVVHNVPNRGPFKYHWSSSEGLLLPPAQAPRS